jgi:hypothetical protein
MFYISSDSFNGIMASPSDFFFLAIVTKMSCLPDGFKLASTHSAVKNGCENCGVS